MSEDLPESVRRLLPSLSSSTTWLKEAWDELRERDNGSEDFGRLLGEAIPYTGTVQPRVIELRRGHTRVQMDDRPLLRNHLGSLHAAALCNLGELAGNLALAYSMPSDARFIVRGLSVEYLKKARGAIEAVCDCPIPQSNARTEYEIEVRLHDASKDPVAVVTLKTLVGPTKASSSPAQ